MENIIHSYSVGVPAGTNPVSGSASWTGVMVGADRSPTDRRDATVGNFIRGDATLTVDFAQTNVDVVFDNIMDLETERVLLDMEWTDIPMTDGAFETGTIQGRFYGEDHEEVGGIFERDLILGAFGAKR